MRIIVGLTLYSKLAPKLLDDLNNLANCAACRTTLEWALDATDSPTCLFPLTQVPLWGIPRRCSQLKWTPPASPARRSSPKVSGAEGEKESFPLYLIILARPTEDGRASGCGPHPPSPILSPPRCTTLAVLHDTRSFACSSGIE